MRATVIQFAPGTDKAANIRVAQNLVAEAVAQDGPSFVSLPEMWSCLGGDRATKLDRAEILPALDTGEGGDGKSGDVKGGDVKGGDVKGGEAWRFLRDTAIRHRVTMHGGSIGERVGDRLFNTSCVFGPDGREIARYRKIHLFDAVTPAGIGYRESSLFGAGDVVTVTRLAGTPTGDVGLGLAICYDLRFPELFLALRRAGAALICLPSAFTVETGRAHWEVLIRARAIETQCWMIAAATCGDHNDGSGRGRTTYGHSLICDPWGKLRVMLADEPGFASADIDLAMMARLRDEMPVLEHRRLA